MLLGFRSVGVGQILLEYLGITDGVEVRVALSLLCCKAFLESKSQFRSN